MSPADGCSGDGWCSKGSLHCWKPAGSQRHVVTDEHGANNQGPATKSSRRTTHQAPAWRQLGQVKWQAGKGERDQAACDTCRRVCSGDCAVSQSSVAAKELTGRVGIMPFRPLRPFAAALYSTRHRSVFGRTDRRELQCGEPTGALASRQPAESKRTIASVKRKRRT